MEIDECFEKGMIKKTKPSNEMAKSLVKMSAIKERVVNKAVLDEETINAYLPMAYESLREVMEAICITRGYKVISHICLGEIVRKLIKDFKFIEFDRFRYIRNGINYYGEFVELEQGKELIEKIFAMRKELLKDLKSIQ